MTDPVPTDPPALRLLKHALWDTSDALSLPHDERLELCWAVVHEATRLPLSYGDGVSEPYLVALAGNTRLLGRVLTSARTAQLDHASWHPDNRRRRIRVAVRRELSGKAPWVFDDLTR